MAVGTVALSIYGLPSASPAGQLRHHVHERWWAASQGAGGKVAQTATQGGAPRGGRTFTSAAASIATPAAPTNANLVVPHATAANTAGASFRVARRRSVALHSSAQKSALPLHICLLYRALSRHSSPP